MRDQLKIAKQAGFEDEEFIGRTIVSTSPKPMEQYRSKNPRR